MHTLVDAPAFAFEQTEFDWGDVVLAAIGLGEWERLERTLAEGLACVGEADQLGRRQAGETLHHAVVSFRRARRLLAGDDYLRWLADRSLATADLRDHLERTALRERAGDRLDGILAGYPPGPAPVTATIRAEATLSGCLDAWAERLARCAAATLWLVAAGERAPAPSNAAAAALLGEASAYPASGLTASHRDAPDRASRIAALLAADQAFCERAVTRERIERCLSEHRLDWQRFAWDEATFAREGAAREAALAVREDQTTLDAVAALAHTRLEAREAFFDQAADLAGLLAASAPGELIGPLACDWGWRLVRVRDRTPAAIEDAGVRERARLELLEDALERHLAGRVHWHGEH
jgi:hypothetical protein